MSITRAHLVEELEQISESQFQTVLDFLTQLKQDSASDFPAPTPEVSTFDRLAQAWLTDTRFLSSTHQMVVHPAYQQIIGLGEAVVPLLLKQLEQKSGHWFWALKSITRTDPVPREARGNTQLMIQAWLNWGRNQGYQW
jgi:hypothetical protein